MIIVHSWCYKHIAEYFLDKSAKAQFSEDTKRHLRKSARGYIGGKNGLDYIYDTRARQGHSRRGGRALRKNMWKLAKENYGLLDHKVSLEMTNDDTLWAWHSVTRWKNRELQEKFFNEHLSIWAESLKANKFVVKHEVSEIADRPEFYENAA